MPYPPKAWQPVFAFCIIMQDSEIAAQSAGVSDGLPLSEAASLKVFRRSSESGPLQERTYPYKVGGGRRETARCTRCTTRPNTWAASGILNAHVAPT